MSPARQVDPRGDATRQRIMAAAATLFAKYGYEGVSTRALADLADANQAAIQYHFGSKEGLYRAIVQRIGDDIADRMHGVREAAEAALGGNHPDAVLRARLLEMLDAFADLMLAESGHTGWADFIARAEIENEGLLEGLTSAVWASAVEPCARLLRRLIAGADEQRAILAALTLLGTITTFKKRCLQKTIARALGWTAFGPHEIALVQRMVREQAEAFLQVAGQGKAI